MEYIGTSTGAKALRLLNKSGLFVVSDTQSKSKLKEAEDYIIEMADKIKAERLNQVKTCCVFGCNNKADKGTLCNKHYLDK